MSPTVQYAELTATTNSTGYVSYTFPNPIDAVVCSGNAPQAGAGLGIVGVSVEQTGANTARARVWVETGSPGQVEVAASQDVTLTFLGLSG